MRTFATILSVFGFIAFAGLAHADEKTEKSVKTESGTTISGQKKTTKTEKVKSADGSSTETKTEVVAPKHDDAAKPGEAKREEIKPAGTAAVTEKTETGTTLTGNKKTTKTKKVENPDGSKTETKTTTEIKK